jgi:hypothetical protein
MAIKHTLKQTGETFCMAVPLATDIMLMLVAPYSINILRN